MRSSPLLLLVLVLAAPALAADNTLPPPPVTVPAPPPMPKERPAEAPPAGPVQKKPPRETGSPQQGSDAYAPEVTIRPHGQNTYEEYRINGRLYMIKVIPKYGPPYYLVDPDGSGRFLRSNRRPDIVPPSWVIKRF